MKKYTAPELNIMTIKTADVITVSAVQFDSIDNWLSDPFDQSI